MMVSCFNVSFTFFLFHSTSFVFLMSFKDFICGKSAFAVFLSFSANYARCTIWLFFVACQRVVLLLSESELSLEKAHELTISKWTHRNQRVTDGTQVTDTRESLMIQTEARNNGQVKRKKNCRRRMGVREAVNMGSEESWLQQYANGEQCIKRNEISL